MPKAQAKPSRCPADQIEAMTQRRLRDVEVGTPADPVAPAPPDFAGDTPAIVEPQARAREQKAPPVLKRIIAAASTISRLRTLA